MKVAVEALLALSVAVALTAVALFGKASLLRVYVQTREEALPEEVRSKPAKLPQVVVAKPMPLSLAVTV